MDYKNDPMALQTNLVKNLPDVQETARTSWKLRVPHVMNLFVLTLVFAAGIGIGTWMSDGRESNKDDMQVVRETAESSLVAQAGGQCPHRDCTFFSNQVPCYHWTPQGILAMEIDLAQADTYWVSSNGTMVNHGYQTLDTSTEQLHEIEWVPVPWFGTDILLLSCFSSGTIIEVKGVSRVHSEAGEVMKTRQGLRHMAENASLSITHYRIEGIFGKSPHAVVLTKKHGKKFFVGIQAENAIAVVTLPDYKVKTIWKVPIPEDVTMSAGGDLHGLCEDSQGHLWFVLKNARYKTLSGKSGMGMVGRLCSPLNPVCAKGERWTLYRFSDLSPSGKEAIPFFIRADPQGRYVWFNSVASDEVGLVDTEAEEPVPKIISLPELNYNWHTLSGMRPGGISVLKSGNALVSLYNQLGKLAHVTTDGNVTYKDIAVKGEKRSAFLHISASDEVLKGGKGSVVLTGSSNDFMSDDLGPDFKLVNQSWLDIQKSEQQDYLRVLTNFDGEKIEWQGHKDVNAPTQISWLHRTLQIFPYSSGKYSMFATTELRTVRLLVSFVPK
mmetsp:Transcript_86476/g.153180  ORF Transcript_86476/g.153180 Transcript_86476/m.153180 type:complete len:553 (+) Transcript_86476:53-1711(+)